MIVRRYGMIDRNYGLVEKWEKKKNSPRDEQDYNTKKRLNAK